MHDHHGHPVETFPIFLSLTLFRRGRGLSLLPPDEADEHAHVVARAVGLDRALQRLPAHVLVRVGNVREVDLNAACGLKVTIKMCI